MRDTFVELYQQYIEREGADELLQWIRESDFMTAPASTRFHGSHEGGLVEHSVNVFNRLGRYDETGAIVALLHDICKANFYTVSYRNQKNEYGIWEKVPYYAVDDKLPIGHGDKSVIIIQKFMKLTDEEIFAIRFHMGDYTDANTGKAFSMFPLALLLHQADEQATYIDEVAK